MQTDRVIICPICEIEISLRWGIFGYETLNRHMKEHKNE